MTMKLLPCPFCGHDTPYFERMGTPRQSCIVVCGDCGARHESSDEGEDSGRSWNERAALAAEQSASVASEPVDVRHVERSFRFDPAAQQHIPTLLVEFEPGSAAGGGDPKAKGWRDRDLLAMMLQGQPTAHIEAAEQPQPDEHTRRLRRQLEQEWADLRALRSAEQPQPEAPSGWRMVPVEPTQAMLAAGVAAESNAPTHVQERLTLLAYRAMLAAAPPPPAAAPTDAMVEAAIEEWRRHTGQDAVPFQMAAAIDAALAAAAKERG